MMQIYNISSTPPNFSPSFCYLDFTFYLFTNTQRYFSHNIRMKTQKTQKTQQTKRGCRLKCKPSEYLTPN